jgi:hypothetical protein
MTPNRKHATLSLAAAMLIFSSGTVFAQDDRQQARSQRAGGLVGALPGSEERPLEAATLPALPAELPARAQQASQTLPPEAAVLPSLPPELPPPLALPALGEPSQSDQLAPIVDDADQFAPIVDLPAPGAEQHVTISQEPAEKKPGFFKRMWTKVKTFVSGVSNKVKTMIANNRAKRAERKAAKALEASSQNAQSPQVFDADIYQGGGDGAGNAAE